MVMEDMAVPFCNHLILAPTRGGGEGKGRRAVEDISMYRRKVRLTECNEKCRYLKKLTYKGTLRQVFYLSEVPSPPMTPYTPPAPTLTHCTRVYSILIHTGKGGR
jgi:hypothetical protein